MDENILSNLKTEPLEENDGDGFNGQAPGNADTEKIIYELSANATIAFASGGCINVNKTMLAFYSPVFAEMFFGLSQGSNVLIQDYDCETFKMFLDGLFGFRKFTAADALLMYPIAYRFKIQKFLDDCKVILAPNSSTEMNENVCLTLNLALLYSCDELAAAVIMFLKNSFGLLNLFEREDFFFLLEPVSVLKVIENVKMNSFVIEVVYKWGVNYLEKNNKMTDIRSFFEESKIFEKISLSYMESISLIFEFQNSSHRKLFTCEEVLNHMNEILLKRPRNLPTSSAWVKIKKGDVAKETINFRQPLTINKSSNNAEIKLKVGRNNIFYEFIEGKENVEDGALDFDISYLFKKQFCSLHCRHRSDICKSAVCQFYTKCGTLRDFSGKRYAKLLIEDSVCNITSVDVTYTFNIDCRILKTSLDNIPLAADDNELYFTCEIQLC